MPARTPSRCSDQQQRDYYSEDAPSGELLVHGDTVARTENCGEGVEREILPKRVRGLTRARFRRPAVENGYKSGHYDALIQEGQGGILVAKQALENVPSMPAEDGFPSHQLSELRTCRWDRRSQHIVFALCRDS